MEVTLSLVGKYVETYAFADGRLDCRGKGCSAFDDNQQHVPHAAITENKRLGDQSWLYKTGGAPSRESLVEKAEQGAGLLYAV